MTRSDNRGSIPELHSVTDLVDIAGAMKASTMVIAGGHRIEDLRLVESARDHGIIDRIILVGDRDQVIHAVQEVGIDIAAKDIVAEDDDESIARQTIGLIQDGSIDIVLKGGISTPVINRHIIRLAVRPTVSLATVVEAAPVADGRPIVITDAGVTTVCNFGRMVNLIENAVEVARVVMGLERPRVAVLSANEKEIPSLPSTWMGRRLAEREWPHALVCGPLSFDLAVDPESVSVKGMPHLPNAEEVAGQADILVCPGIDAANILYKTFTAMSKFGQASLAGITVGFPVPYIILSRADTLETRLLSIALCSIYAQRTVETRRGAAEKKVQKTKGCRILVVNPGSTSLKLALYNDTYPLQEQEVPLSIPSLNSSEVAEKQVEGVVRRVLDTLEEWGEKKVDAIAARGGFVPRPPGKLGGGTYTIAEVTGGKVKVDEPLVKGIMEQPEMVHASNLGIPAAAELATRLGVPAYTVDPVIVDEFIPEAEISGFKPVRRVSISHALSVRAAAGRAAEQVGRPLEDVNLVVAHLGGGITVAALRGGRMIDNNIALLGEGPFTPQRAGTLPLGGIIELCCSGEYTREELVEQLSRRGGLVSYLGEYRMEIIEKRIADGDEEARIVVDAMVHRIVKEIGSMFAVLESDVEAVVLTGGLVRSPLIRNGLRRKAARLAPVFVFEEPLEMDALASGVYGVLSGETKPLRFPDFASGD